MHISHFQLIDLDLWNAFCKVSSWGSFLFTLQRQNKVCTPGDEAIMKIHMKLFSGIPFNFTLFVVSPKIQRIWSWNFGFAIRKIWAFIWYQKIYYFRLSPGGWECDRHKVLQCHFWVSQTICFRMLHYLLKQCWYGTVFPISFAAVRQSSHSNPYSRNISSNLLMNWINLYFCMLYFTSYNCCSWLYFSWLH